MTTTTAPPPPARRERRDPPPTARVPYQGLFREPAYLDGKPYDDDPEDQDDPGAAG